MPDEREVAADKAAAAARRTVLATRDRRSFVPVIVVGIAILSGVMLFVADEDRAKPSASGQSQVNRAAPN